MRGEFRIIPPGASAKVSPTYLPTHTSIIVRIGIEKELKFSGDFLSNA